MDDVQLLDGEIAELNEAVTRSHNRSNELRARLGSLPPASGAGEFVAGTMGREADPLSDAEYVDSVAGAQLRALLSGLTEREREVLATRFGLDGHEPERAVEVAERLGLSVNACAGSSGGRSPSLPAAQAPGADSD